MAFRICDADIKNKILMKNAYKIKEERICVCDITILQSSRGCKCIRHLYDDNVRHLCNCKIFHNSHPNACHHMLQIMKKETKASENFFFFFSLFLVFLCATSVVKENTYDPFGMHLHCFYRLVYKLFSAYYVVHFRRPHF